MEKKIFEECKVETYTFAKEVITSTSGTFNGNGTYNEDGGWKSFDSQND